MTEADLMRMEAQLDQQLASALEVWDAFTPQMRDALKDTMVEAVKKMRDRADDEPNAKTVLKNAYTVLTSLGFAVVTVAALRRDICRE